MQALMLSRAALTAAALLLFTLCAAGQGTRPPAPAPSTFNIIGVVVQHRTNQRLKRVRVTILQNDHPDRQASLMTADDGRFRFTGVPLSKYTLMADLHGEQRTFQQDDFFSTGVVVGPALDSEHIVFPFPAPTSLSVKVIDEEGEPVRGVQVLLFTKRISAGWSHIELAGQNSTSPEGSSRFAHLEPGTYFAAASGRPWYAQDPMMNGQGEQAEASTELNVAYPITYYAATQDAEAAAPIHLAEGDKAQVQITLRAVPAMKISVDGVASNPDPMRGGQIMTVLEAVGPGGIRFPAMTSSYQSGSEWQMGGVAPGNYIVSVSQFGGGRGNNQSLGSARIAAAADAHVNASELTKTTVSGHVVLEGQPEAGNLAIRLVQPANGSNVFCPVARDGSFHCSAGGRQGGSLAPGLYQVRLARSEELFAKSIAVKGATYTGGLLDIREGTSADLAIVAAKGATKLNGIALAAGRPFSGAMVLLVPQDSGSDGGIPRDQSDSNGTFTLPDVHPGRYLLVAIDHGHNLEYHDPKTLQPYLTGAQTIQIPLAHDDLVRVNVQLRQ